MYTFVILHYKSYTDTIECIESILKLPQKIHIVIVDNASKNGSIDRIYDKYKFIKNIHIIKNEDNLGFADGNNIGYKYAREKLKAKFILICNNDLIFDQKDYLIRLSDIYESTKAHIIGPDIESLTNGEHQNPMSGTSNNLYYVTKEILRYRLLLILSKLNIYDILKKRKSQNSQKRIIKNSIAAKSKVLHGAMLIFTPRYVENEEKAFRSGTFLYMEEDILYLYAKNKNYITLYTPDLHVYHKEDSSTNEVYKSSKKKREFVFKNMINSLKIYRKYLISIKGMK